ncbi:HAD-IIIC family phosphatase [Niallia sp. FSL W8-0954]|uniref:HAD-IIIC family phosphatase n=2 Tax=Niallia TaxID=2837506 RepID=UPI0030F6A19F
MKNKLKRNNDMLNNPGKEEFLNILQTNEAEKLEAKEQINITIFTNVTLKPIFDTYLIHFLLQNQISAELSFLDIDETIMKIHKQHTNLLQQESDFIIIFPNINALNDNLFKNPYQLDKNKLIEETISVKHNLLTLLKGIRKHSEAIILWNLFELPSIPTVMINSNLDYNPYKIIKNLNDFMEVELDKSYNTFVIDLNLVLYRFGAEFIYDKRQWHWSRSPYSKDGCREITRYMASNICALRGKSRKCLVLDCDDLLWGGIIGEEGIQNIRLSPYHPGSAYYEFQQEVLNFYNRGILIALCSKNNEYDVIEVIRNHPHMLIKENHLAAYEINWDDKATNLLRIANKLNISLDSLVFMDDSEWEVFQIQELLPEVKAIHMPRKKPYLFRDKLLEAYELSNQSLTSEDTMRTKMYQEEQDRIRDKSLKSDMDILKYYRTLQMKVKVSLAEQIIIPRVAQLTQKTNQFNLTTIRCTEDEIRQRCNNENYDVIVIQLEDRFGDFGVIGTSIIHYEGEKAVIEHFILSCRALGRLVEDALLSSIIQRTKYKGITKLIGVYKASPKNKQTELFYEKRGFQQTSKNEISTIYICNPFKFKNSEKWRESIEICSTFE